MRRTRPSARIPAPAERGLRCKGPVSGSVAGDHDAARDRPPFSRLPVATGRPGLSLIPPLHAAFLLFAVACTASAPAVDPDLATYIAGIHAIDDHAHPMRPVMAGEPADTDFDALPLDGIPPFDIPWRLLLENPEWDGVARVVFDVADADTSADGLRAAREQARAAHGRDYALWVLDRIGTDIMLANRIAMGDGLAPPRFRWIAFADPLLFPLDTRAEAGRTPDAAALYPKEDALLRRYMADLGVTTLPRSLAGFVTDVVFATLGRERQLGAVAIKFEAAYLRSLDFTDPDADAATRVYARYVNGGAPTRAEYKVLEDYLFREIAREAGRLGMVVQIHVFNGFGGYYDTSGSEPRRLQPVFDDPSLRGTRFVIVHGGWPEVGQSESMMSKPNVWADISMMDLVLEPSRLALVLRQWLQRWPDRVLFGSDAFDGGPDQTWADVAAFSSRSARDALGIALTGMLRDGEITRERAQDLARMVLRENALAVYPLAD